MYKQTKSIFAIFLIIGIGIGSVSVAHALDTKLNKSLNTKLKKNKIDTVLPLTAGECTQLGGTVQSDGGTGICNSGKFCGTRDQNGVAHRVCITAAAQ
jgi:hypothetical protein